jgi:(p)ppGpp synthase/HD superfamily hydrolase
MLDVYKGGGDLSTVRAAVLHDVVEDTDILLDEVHAVLGDRTAILVDILTHAEGEPYKAFIERVAKSEDATLIKLADLRDNMDPSRITNKSGLYKRYAKAYWRLNMGAWPR